MVHLQSSGGNFGSFGGPGQFGGFGGGLSGGVSGSQFAGGAQFGDLQSFISSLQAGPFNEDINALARIRGLQLQDLSISQQLRGALLPGEAQLELGLRQQIIPGQLQQLGSELGQAQGIFGGLAGQAVSQLQGLPIAGELIGLAQGGLEGLAEGGLPSDVQRELEQSFFSTVGALGLQGQPSALQPLTQALGSTGVAIQEQIRQSRINQALGISQGLGLPTAGGILQGAAGLLGSTGLPDLGFGPIGFQGAAGLDLNALELLAAHRGRKSARRDVVVGGIFDVAAGFAQGFGSTL